MTSLIEVRRFLHVNYNCRRVEALEEFYVELFGLRSVMRSTSSGSDVAPFGIFGTATSETAFVYDHRGGRRSSALELVQWIEPATVGSVYPDPWNTGIQSVAYSASDLAAIATRAVQLGGSVERQSAEWLLLRDPEGVAVEVLRADGSSEAKYLRIVCSDLQRTAAWWEALGFSDVCLGPVAGAEIWGGDAARSITAERGMVGTDDPSFGIVLTTWSGPLPISPTYGPPYHQGLYRMALAVDSISDVFTKLAEAGLARQSPYTFQLPGTKLTDGLTMMFLRDPDAILVELVDRPRQAQFAAIEDTPQQ